MYKQKIEHQMFVKFFSIRIMNLELIIITLESFM